MSDGTVGDEPIEAIAPTKEVKRIGGAVVEEPEPPKRKEIPPPKAPPEMPRPKKKGNPAVVWIDLTATKMPGAGRAASRSRPTLTLMT